MDYTIDDLQVLIEESGGVISRKTLQEAGIERLQIYNFLVNGILVKESHGYYTLADNKPDEYTIIQSRSEKLVFSHETALYLHGLSDRVPHILDITVPQGDNVSRIKKDYQMTHFHYCKKELWCLGIENVKTPQGYIVKAYNPERCICDLVKNKDKTDIQIYKQAIREYFSGNKCNPGSIIEYACEFNVEERIRSYMEVLG